MLKSHEKHEHEKIAEKLGIITIDILIVSDSRTYETDETGKWLKSAILDDEKLNIKFGEYNLIKNNSTMINEQLEQFLNNKSHALIISGGTGLSSRDITIETIKPKFNKELDGFGEIFRYLSFQEIGSRAILSRATLGIINSKVIFLLPGSLNAVKLAYDKIIKEQIHHLIYEATR